MRMPFPETFERIAKRHPNKAPASKAEAFWKLNATTEDAANAIEAAHSTWCESRGWQDGIGIPTLANFLREKYFENVPAGPAAAPETLLQRIERMSAEMKTKKAAGQT